jgi:hypothetical protein
MLKRSLLFFLCFFTFLFINAQEAVYQLPVSLDAKIKNPTFFYTLPQTTFKADVVVTKTSNIKGLYADFAEKLLGITNYCKENSVSYQLKKIYLTSFVIPDENLQFVVELSSEQLASNFLSSSFRHNLADNLHISGTAEKNDADLLPDFFKNYADVILQHTYETYTETKIIDGVVTQVPVTQTKVTTKTLAQQAQQAADFIEKIREDRYAILSFEHETTLSKEAFEYLVNQLNELEKKYLELFVGITVFEDIHETVNVYPKKGELLPLCSISPTGGFSSSMSQTAAYNYYLQCTPDASLNMQTNFREAYSSATQKQKTGYRIRKAVSTFVSLVNLNKEENLGVFPVYQFGLLETLPPRTDSFEIGKWGYIY